MNTTKANTPGSVSLDAIPADRQSRLKAWLALKGLKIKTLAEQSGFVQPMVHAAIKGEKPYAHVIDALVRLGVPRELLPESKTVRVRGPYRKNE